jgi:hypothetical protein
MFQNVLLNIQSVRINTNVNAGPGSNGWQNIPTPPGIGGGNQNAVLQIDLNTSQDVPALFNTVPVRPATYQLAEILLDPNNPGALIPNCPQSPGGTEGCINYPIALTNGQVITAMISGVAPTKGTITPLIIQLQLMINQNATVAGGPYIATLIPSQSTTALGTVMGPIAISGSSSGATGKLSKLAVTAETIGTNTAIASALINKSTNTYTLVLPAAGQFGTLYDLAVAGGGDSFSAARLPPVVAGGMVTGPKFTVVGQKVGNITGMVSDVCTTKPIVGATLQLLIPPGDQVSPNTAIDCTNPAMAPQCITVATANTDSAGNFPMPGSLTTPAQFQNVPVPPTKNTNGAYAMEVTAPGYDPLFVQVRPSTGAGKNTGGTCAAAGTSTFSKCDLVLSTAYITGMIPIAMPPPGQTTLVQVFAEPHGTNNIQSSLPMPINVRNPNTSVMFKINVPSLISSFDLFATTIDKFQGVTDPFQGHTISVFSPVAQPGQCLTSPPVMFDQTLDCVGHGSIIGTASNANLGASIALSKLDSMGNPVQITTAQIENQGSISPLSGSAYAFCVPGDIYELQPVQLPQPVPGEIPAVVPSPALTGEAVPVTVPQAPLVNGPSPSATPTPKIKCPTTCSNTDGTCPGTCNTQFVNPIMIPPPPTVPFVTATPTATASP